MLVHGRANGKREHGRVAISIDSAWYQLKGCEGLDVVQVDAIRACAGAGGRQSGSFGNHSEFQLQNGVLRCAGKGLQRIVLRA